VSGRLRRASLLHFVALGAALYVILDVLAAPREEIVIAVGPAVAVREAALGRALSAEERAALLDRIVQEEVLVREAFRLGLHTGGRIQKRLADKMIVLLQDDVPAPDEAELRALFDANLARYGPEPPPFDAARGALRNEWRFTRARAIVDAKVAELRRDYRVVIEDDAP